MRIDKKIIIVSLSGLVLLGSIALGLSFHSLHERGKAETTFVRSMMLDQKKGKLHDLVKSTYAIIQAHYE